LEGLLKEKPSLGKCNNWEDNPSGKMGPPNPILKNKKFVKNKPPIGIEGLMGLGIICDT